MKSFLSPTLEDLRLECVLVQAWKKTASYIRSHNWYSDTLELDYQSLRLPDFIREVQAKIDGYASYSSEPLRIVPAPKAQKWKIRNGVWSSVDRLEERIRPLAHASLHDQVLATALMLCLADRAETLHGDPRGDMSKPSHRAGMTTYGHRLFCDGVGGGLVHRWGSSKLYRNFFSDYRSFLKRPDIVAAEVEKSCDVAIIQTDLSRFYDRVRPAVLNSTLRNLWKDVSEDGFFHLAERLFNWSWYDKARTNRYAAKNSITGFDRVALPQGLVASGFFSNIVLADLDRKLKNAFGKPLSQIPHSEICDACHYVDDFRIVCRVPKGTQESEIQGAVVDWLNRLIHETSEDLGIEGKKTSVTVLRREQRFLVNQSKAAERIQHEVSGTFDMLHGSELIGAIEGFFHTQKTFSASEEAGRIGLLVGISDMKDDTAARFAAGKFRRTFRSLRPMLEAEEEAHSPAGKEDIEEGLKRSLVLSREQLDERAKLFAATLLEEWIVNPGNVRLLRIAMDLHPNPKFLTRILELLRPSWQLRGTKGAKREIRAYCLAELFRAGATETGLVRDDDALPADCNVEAYHQTLLAEAKAVFKSYQSQPGNAGRFPWYLMQQVMLYLAVRNAFESAPGGGRYRTSGPLARYKAFFNFAARRPTRTNEERAVFSALGTSAFGHEYMGEASFQGALTPDYYERLLAIAPGLASELWDSLSPSAKIPLASAARKAGLIGDDGEDGDEGRLPRIAMSGHNPFVNERNLLSLATAIIDRHPDLAEVPVNPWQIRCNLERAARGESSEIGPEDIQIDSKRSAHRFFVAPDWCDADERRKVLLGQLLRFSLRGGIDYFRPVRRNKKAILPRYKKPVSCLELLRYGSYNGRAAFGPDWIPISSYTEDLLIELLRWPGCGNTSPTKSYEEIRRDIADRVSLLSQKYVGKQGLLCLRQRATPPERPWKSSWERPLRVGLVQTIIPGFDEYRASPTDPQLNDGAARRKQRRHLAAVMEGVAQMLRIRETHRSQPRQDKQIVDWLIFPELSVHPEDVESILIPFVRVHRCMILAGLVFHPRDIRSPEVLINSAIWLIPEWTEARGLQIRRVEQGKQNLAREEACYEPHGLIPFRPAQWIVSYEWSGDGRRPLFLTSSICYDATDLTLAADLRDRTDLYAVCALNSDVGTFDRMAEGLHYHLYQGMIVVNNGAFGGTNFFLPFEKAYLRQVLHVHGQPQAAISFVEVSPWKLINRPNDLSPDEFPTGDWKTQPAGWKNPGEHFGY